MLHDDTFAPGARYLTFGGVETFLIYRQGVALREFCSFEALDDEAAWADFVDDFLRPIAESAAIYGFGLLTDTLGWRASPDYVARLGHAPEDVARYAKLGASRVRQFAERHVGARSVVLAADLGPRGDGYALEASGPVAVEAAERYHRPQLEAIAQSGVDLVTAWTMTSVAESIGVARVAKDLGLPLIVSPTLETDGKAVDGASLGDFVTRVDEATDGYPLLYTANCVHPDHIEPALRDAKDRDAPWRRRFRGLRVNASAKSHAELDASTELDRGDPAALGAHVARLAVEHDLAIVGGCCGTDPEHLEAIARGVQERTRRDPRRASHGLRATR